MVTNPNFRAIIQPEYEPEKFLKLYGEVLVNDHHNVVIPQQLRALAWDAAIKHVVLQEPIQKPRLTTQIN